MKTIQLWAVMLLTLPIFSQSNVNELLAAGLNDAEKFTDAYLTPVSEGLVYSISSGWYNSAKAKPLGGFEISFIGTMVNFKNKDDKKAFMLNTADYENLQFQDGSTSKMVSTALGDIQGVRVVIEGEVSPGVMVSEEIELPTGLASENINFVPSGFIQGSVGLIKGTELKARFLPKISSEDGSFGLVGIGLQHDFTEHLPADKIIPVAISGVVGYTMMNGEYDFTSTAVIDGSDQRIETKINSLVVQAVVSTRLPVINFYGGVGYLSGKADTDVLGTYVVQSGPFQQTYTDPFTFSHKTSGVVGNIGTKLKLGFFRIHADYSLGEFNNLSFGVNFGFR
jgi:hypothetical protein